MRVGIDLDGVVYNFHDSLREFLVQEAGYDPAELPDPVRWEFHGDWGLTLESWLTACHMGVDAGIVFAYGEPHAGSKDAFDLLRLGGHTIHIVTDRTFGAPGLAAKATVSWLH